MADEFEDAHVDPFDVEGSNADPFEADRQLVASPPSYGFSMVHDRVFVTWFNERLEDEYLFVSEPAAIELSPEEAQQFHDLFNQQMDKMQALLQGFVENRKEAAAMDDGAGLKVEIRRECPNCGAFKPDPNAACTFC